MIASNTINLRKKFLEHFGSDDGLKYFFAPGRVNLIGEHIDYNGGYVFPAALSIGITALIRPNYTNTIRMISLNVPGEVIVNLEEEIKYQPDDWGNYPKGVFYHLIKEGYKLHGYDILYSSSLPDGAGLSSSAAIEVLTTYMMLNLLGKENIDKIWIAKFCQNVENKFVNVACGIMDQFAVAMGKQDAAILLDCDSLEYRYIPLHLKEYSLVIMNTNKRRELAESKYNERRSECDESLRLINKHEVVQDLCNATLAQVDKYVHNDILKKRARHVITENNRVLEAIKTLENGDILAFAALLTESHYSLKYDYEVTGYELDTIVEEALKTDACLGARMTGAGFGGCAIALVKTDSMTDFINTVTKSYETKTYLTPEFYETKISSGVGEYLTEMVSKNGHYTNS